ncbi:MAG TPA: DUF2516 family protein [Actinomycetes bacterium]|nr:DUF2516 family protein [Actinomycetes bacterium]
MTITAAVASLLWIGLGVVKVVALVDALRRREGSFVAASKQSKKLWLLFLGLGLAFHVITGVLSIVNLAGTIAAFVYLVDVRRGLDAVEGRGRGSSSGPYGPW